jgi:predicted HicB family RNase H-like nuclease
MRTKHRNTLATIFTDPVSARIRWRDIEALFRALGGELVEGRGSRVTVFLGEAKATFHRLHPRPGHRQRSGACGSPVSASDRRATEEGKQGRVRPMTVMRHGDYVAQITYDEEIDSFFGEVINTSDVITFYGQSIEELRREMAISIEAHLEACRTKGIEPSRPYSGKFNLRLSPDDHARVAAAAAAAGKSMNRWVAEVLSKAAERELAR